MQLLLQRLPSVQCVLGEVLDEVYLQQLHLNEHGDWHVQGEGNRVPTCIETKMNGDLLPQLHGDSMHYDVQCDDWLRGDR